MGHVSKVAYFGAMVAEPAGHDLEQWRSWPSPPSSRCGHELSRSMLDRMSDKQFY